MVQSKVLKNYRLTQTVIDDIEYLQSVTGDSATDIVETSVKKMAEDWRCADELGVKGMLKIKLRMQQIFQRMILALDQVDYAFVKLLEEIDFATHKESNHIFERNLRRIHKAITYRLDNGSWLDWIEMN